MTAHPHHATMSTRSPRRRIGMRAGAVAVCALLLAACGSSAAETTATTASTEPETPTTTVAPEVDAFYTTSAGTPAGPPGTIVRSQAVTAPDGARGWRVMYVSRSVTNEPVFASGLIWTPTTGDVPAGGRPVVTWAHETTGVADDCAPSRDPETALSPAQRNQLLRDGYVVVETDYQGLGTPGIHPYLVGMSEARSVLDIVRAARTLPETQAGSRVAVFGYSQGGHATLFAAEQAPTYAPELTLVGSAAIAPPADLSQVSTEIGRNRQLAGFGVLAAVGFHAAYPDELPLDAMLAPEVVEQISAVDATCSAFAFYALALRPFSRVFNPAILTNTTLQEKLVVNSAGAQAPEGPVLILNGGKDVLATPAMIDTYTKAVCPKGAVVQVVTKADRDHGGIYRGSFDIVGPWIKARFAGEPATSTCPGAAR
jgi:pimeloyl-ACP methyl ester carboxylesterase